MQGKPCQTQLPIMRAFFTTLVLLQEDRCLLGNLALLAVTEIFSSWFSSPRAVKTNPWTPHQCACQTTAGASTSLHSCDDQCHNTMCMPGLVYAAPNWSMQGNKASSMNKVMGSRFGRVLWVMNTINTNCRTVCFSYHKYCE